MLDAMRGIDPRSKSVAEIPPRGRLRSVLITGAGLGFGRALVSVYAAREWVVFPLVRDEPTARRLKDKVGGSA